MLKLPFKKIKGCLTIIIENNMQILEEEIAKAAYIG